MSRKNFTRAFLAASSALVFLTAVSPIALASDHGKSGEHGKGADKSTVNSILGAIQSSSVFDGKGKKFENDGNALKEQTNSLLKKLNKLSAGNPAVAVAGAQQGFQTEISAANLVLKGALAAQLGLPTPTPSSA